VFLTLSNGTVCAFFDRPGVGAAHGGGDKYVQDQGLRWWTGVIVNVDRNAGPEDTVIFKICKEIHTPVIVTRNKVEHDLRQEQQTKVYEGDPFDRNQSMQEMRDYLSSPKVGLGTEAKLIDTEAPDNFQFEELVEWCQKLSTVSRA